MTSGGLDEKSRGWRDFIVSVYQRDKRARERESWGGEKLNQI